MLVRLSEVSLVIIKVDLFYRKSKFSCILFSYVASGFSLMMSFVKFRLGYI